MMIIVVVDEKVEAETEDSVDNVGDISWWVVWEDEGVVGGVLENMTTWKTRKHKTWNIDRGIETVLVC